MRRRHRGGGGVGAGKEDGERQDARGGGFVTVAPEAPALSVILPCEEGFEFIARSVQALRAQTVQRRIELVVVVPDEAIEIVPGAETGFHSVCVVVAPGLQGNRARAAGIRKASAGVVALAEDHCLPESGWAEALIAAHEQGWSAVGPRMINANPATVTSWVNLLLTFGPWVRPDAPSPMDQLPWHNTSYKRAPLLEYGEGLGDLMVVEGMLQADLVSKGHRLYLEPAARVHHLNISMVSSTVVYSFKSSRLFAGQRSHTWSPLKRLGYVLASPLIPLVRLRRTLPMIPAAPDRNKGLLSLVAGIVALLVLDTVGEVFGYVAGAGSAAEDVESFEHRRFRFLSRADRRAYDADDIAPVGLSQLSSVTVPE